ncbi:MAG: hypothetical protein K2K46_00010, partial [Lachnospiraceae bacterium]|nr:hypothetical protein [Lachnospiraceae bacterium]
MTKTEDGITVGSSVYLATDMKTGRKWSQNYNQEGYPFCTVTKTVTYEKRGQQYTYEGTFLDCYLTDYIKTHEESDWPSFVIKGSDGVPFYLYDLGDIRNGNCYYTKWCYDEETGWWIRDKAYKGSKVPSYGFSDAAIAKAEAEKEQMIEDMKEDIATGEVVENGTPVEPDVPDYIDKVVDSDDVPTQSHDGNTLTYPDGRVEYMDNWHDDHRDKHIVYPDGHVEYYCGEKIIRIEYPDGRVEYPENPDNPPKEDEENKDLYADVNTLGATVTLKTDCIKVKTNKKGVVAQKPLPKSVKIGKKALKKNKTFTVSYEKYTNEWKTVDAVTDEGIYRLVITGKNGYDGVYKKRLYVTADKTIKAMSSVSVKVNKMSYTGNPITSDVIKTAKIGKRTLTEGTDYTVTYTNNTDSGTAQVTLTAKENSGLLGTKTVNFTITGNKMSKVKVTGISSITYNPNETMEQDMSNVKLAYNGTPLNKDTDFTVSYVNNTKAGTAKIVFTGKGLYNGTLTKKFKITKARLSDSMLDDASKNIEVTYTGKAMKPDVTLKNGNTLLKKGTDYTLTYKNNKKVSTAAAPAQITVKGKGSYTGSFKVNFTIIAKSNGDNEKSNAKSIKPEEEDDNLTEDEAVVDEPITEETVADEPTEEEPVSDEPTGDEPVTEEPTGDEPVTDEPRGDEPVSYTHLRGG